MSLAVTGVALWALFAADAGFNGWRAAAGRDGRISKRGYYVRAFLGGLLAGQVPFAIAALAALLLVRRDPALGADLAACGLALLEVYVPYALAIALVFLVRATPSVDVRSLTSVIFFAPAVIARPLVIVGGVAFAIAARPRVETAALGVFSAVAALSLGPFLDRRATARIRSFRGGGEA